MPYGMVCMPYGMVCMPYGMHTMPYSMVCMPCMACIPCMPCHMTCYAYHAWHAYHAIWQAMPCIYTHGMAMPYGRLCMPCIYSMPGAWHAPKVRFYRYIYSRNSSSLISLFIRFILNSCHQSRLRFALIITSNSCEFTVSSWNFQIFSGEVVTEPPPQTPPLSRASSSIQAMGPSGPQCHCLTVAYLHLICINYHLICIHVQCRISHRCFVRSRRWDCLDTCTPIWNVVTKDDE